MGVNEPLPGQLTVGRLRELLKDAHDQAVVSLCVRETIEVRPPFNYVLVNLKVAKVTSPIVALEIQSDLSVPPAEPAA